MTAAAYSHRTSRFDRRWPVEILVLAALYFLTARLGLLMAIPGGHVTPVWPPSGLALAAILLCGRRIWPGIWLGSFAANLLDFYGGPSSLAAGVATSATFGIGASLAALLGSLLLRWFVSERDPLERVRDVCAFMGLGGVVSCVASATIGVTTLCLAGFAPWSVYGQTWLTWWLGDTGGVFVVAPLFLVWGGARRRESAARWVELVGGFGLLIAVTYYVFIENRAAPFAGKPPTFVLVPFLVWAAVRFERRGAATASGLIAVLAVWGTIQGSGPFNLASRDESLVDLEFFLGVVSFTALSIAAMAAARRRVLDELESRVMERTAALNQANAALAEQALRYKTLMETSTDSIYVMDEKGDLQEANAAFLRRRGYTAAEAKGLNVADWDARFDREQLQKRMRQLAGSSAVFETRHRCKDGSIFDVEVCATSVRIGGKPLFFVVTRDITERKKTESALGQLAQVSAASSDYIALIGRDFRYQFVNDTYLKARGLHLVDMIGRHMKDIVGQERFERLGRPQVEACLRGEEVENFEWTDFRSDLRCFLHVKVAPMREPDGTIQGVVMSGRDITARYEAEQALRKSEERFRELAENINEVFWIWTATPGNARCLYVSPAYATIWGRSCESLYSSPQSWMEALHPQDKERVREEGARMDFEKISDWTYRIVRLDRSIRWIRDRIFPVRDVLGAVVRFAGIAQDITESKEAEQTVRKTNRQLRNLSRRRIQEQEDERRRLSRELHDQIGQSLTAAKINVEVVRSTENPALVGRLDETAAILDQLLGQVRQISLDLRPPMLDDLGLVPALRSFVDEQGRRASVAVRFSAERVPEKLDPEIQITCFRIAQEAITNAVRHAKATQLEIALRCTHGKKLRLLARDNGIGFDAHPRQAQAVDLGLIGIRERAALVGGRAKIISSPREGTTIDVSLPLTFRPERQARHLWT